MFRRNIKQGNYGESVVAFYLGDCEIMKGYFPDYDILCRGRTYEVKYDLMRRFTNNYYIEFTYKDNPSGISATKADVFVLMDKDELRFYDTELFRQYLIEHMRLFKHIKKGGDGGHTTGALIHRDTIHLLDNALFNHVFYDARGTSEITFNECACHNP